MFTYLVFIKLEQGIIDTILVDVLYVLITVIQIQQQFGCSCQIIQRNSNCSNGLMKVMLHHRKIL